jgi:transcription initiation factor TFIIA large subunit
VSSQAQNFANANRSHQRFSQGDGADTDEFDGVESYDFSPTSPVRVEGEEPVGSDLDDNSEENEPETNDYIVCQFEKVNRVKNKHKCQLKDGIMHINGRDHLFSKAPCDFEFYYRS